MICRAFTLLAGLVQVHVASSLRIHSESSRQRSASSSDLAGRWDLVRPESEADPRVRPTVLHFMFELKDKFPHPGIWGQFFDSAQPGTVMAWAHCTNHHSCKNDYVLELLKVKLIPTTWSIRGADLMTPFVQMIRYALPMTEHLAAAGVTEKFMVISDSTLPVKPFAHVYWDQAASPSSDICISSPDQWAHGIVDGVPTALVKQHQWVSLNRSDASVLAREWLPVTKLKGWNVPLRHARWAGLNRSVPRALFQGGTWYTATDEEAVYAFLFGPLVLSRLDDPVLPRELFRHRRCSTYVAFPHDLEQVAAASPARTAPVGTSSMLQIEAEASASFDHTIITRQLLQDPDAKLTVPPGTWHPFLMEKLGDRSLHVLRRSPYLFARKFSPCAELANFSEVVFAS